MLLQVGLTPLQVSVYQLSLRSIRTNNKQTSKQQTLQTLMSQPVETALHKIIRE